MNTLSNAINIYLEFCAGLFRPLLDGQPWSAIAVNPAPVFRARVSRAEKSREFNAVAKAFEQLADPAELVIEGPDRVKHFWHVAAFFWNCGVYDAVIRGQHLVAAQLADAMSQEAGRKDARYKEVAYLDSFASVSAINVGPFRIRHLDAEEIDALFAGRCQLDHRESPESVREKLADSWFVVVDNPARPLADYISLGGAVGHHDWEGTFRNINLGLNLFKAAAGPVVLAHTYNWNSSLYHRQQHECPEPHRDLYPSSWGGSEEPPPMHLYQLGNTVRPGNCCAT